MKNINNSCATGRAHGRGFTFIELVVTLAVISIVMLIAVANINTGRSEALNGAREFKTALSYARSESLNRSRTVVVCASSTAMENDSLACGGSWHQGWLVFVDEDGNDAPAVSELLRRHAGLSNSVSVTAAATSVEFSSRGFSSSAVDFRFCTSEDASAGRTISLAASGRAMKQAGATDCS